MRRLLTTSLILFAVLAAPAARAEYPEKRVQFIVPASPGELQDVLTRLIAAQMQADTGITATVVNRPGAEDDPFAAVAEVARAQPDGYTIGSFVIGVPAVGALLGDADIGRDTFEPVGIFLTYPYVLAARSEAPYSNMAELARYAKRHRVALGHFGYARVSTRAAVMAGLELGFEFGSEAAFEALDCNTLAAGDADVISTTLPLIRPCLGKVKVLAVIAERRIAPVPDAATLAEQVRGVDVTSWNGLFVPKGTPGGVKRTIAASARKTVTGRSAQDLARESGALVYWQNADEAEARYDADYRKIRDMLRRMGDL